MKWSYGVTTVPSRFPDLLPRTLTSLSKAGFDRPRLFIDGIPRDVPGYLSVYHKTFHDNVKAFGNWVMAAWELYLHEPHADRFAVFQDDFVTYRGLRGYLEQCDYPKQGYWNLYTFPENEKANRQGWYPSNQRGLGAVALVFDNEALRLLLCQRHMIDRPLDATRGHKFVDGGIVDSFKKAGWQEYVHSPSLVQHTGQKSSIGNKHQPLALSFRGEEFDAMTLVQSQVVPASATPVRRKVNSDRIGLVGYNCATGLGELNRQLATYAEVDTWLVKPHREHPSFPPHVLVDTIVCELGQTSKIEAFMRAVDIVVFCELPYYPNLLQFCKTNGKRTVCVPMMEWMPAGAKGWPREVDLFICPTLYCYEQFRHVIPSVYFPWPVDLARYEFRPRTACRKFLFVGGHGGFKGRKGTDVMRRAKELWREMPLAVRSQASAAWPDSVEVLGPVTHNHELYGTGDVLVAPHSVDGLGLEPMEAMACGMPVITTDGRPWNEIPSIAKIPAPSEKRSVRRPVDWYLPQPEALAEICKGLCGRDITEASQAARAWAEERSWEKWAPKFISLVRNGVGIR